jgi:hypothetical protein
MQSFEEVIESHQCFVRDEDDFPSEARFPLRNETCFHLDVGLFVINPDSILLLDINTKNYIKLSPQSRIHPMHGVLINASGNMLAIQGMGSYLFVVFWLTLKETTRYYLFQSPKKLKES